MTEQEELQKLIDLILTWKLTNTNSFVDLASKQFAKSLLDAGFIHKNRVVEFVPACKCVYQSERYGIEIINAPSGTQGAIGGTNQQDRWKHCPHCGGTINGGF